MKMIPVKTTAAILMAALLLTASACSNATSPSDTASSADQTSAVSTAASAPSSSTAKGDTTSKTSDTSGQKVSQSSAEKTSDKSGEETSDTSAEETSDESGEETSDTSAEETSDESGEETSDTSGEETSDELSEETSDTSAEETSDNSREESKAHPSAPTDEKQPGDIPALPDENGTDVGEWVNNVLVYQRTAYEMFYGWDGAAQDYAAAISKIKKALGDSVTVYNIIVPTHCGITLPQRFFDTYGISDQNHYINTILNSYTEDIIGINPFQTLMHHRDEYLYFNTDHHWTGLAAYYAYQDFCRTAGINALQLTQLTEGSIEGYYGSLTNYVDTSLVNVDTVHYYTMDADTSTSVFDEYGGNEQPTRLFHDYAEGVNAYGVFLGGDSPLMVCRNQDGNGRKIAVVKESYGNAFSPYIALTYSETHMIDFRYISFDFEQYLKDNEIDEVIFVNNTMASATPNRIDELNALTK